MTSVIPFRSDQSMRALALSAPPPSPEPLARVDDTLVLIAQAAETIRRLQEARADADARAAAAFDQMQADRADWKVEWERLALEASDARQQLAASEAQFAEARIEVQAGWRRCGEAEAREAAALARAEQAEARARAAEDWLSRIQDTVVSEFAMILGGAAS